MTKEDFHLLPNRRIKFITYTGKIIIGGNYTEHVGSREEFFIITDPKKGNELTLEEKIREGILVPIKPEIIDDYIVL